MITLRKFLFFFELEVGAFAIGMFGFSTSFLIEVFIVMLLYHSDCLGLFKLYACATIVAYYMFASFMLVKEIFCDRKPSFVKHFLVIDIIVSCVVISADIKLYELYPNWWPLFLTDGIIRLYSELCIYSLLVKYKNNVNTEKLQQTTAVDKSTTTLDKSKSEPSNTKSTSLLPSKNTVEGVMRVFDNFCGFYSLEMSGLIYCGVNIASTVLLFALLLIFADINEDETLIFAVIFSVNTLVILVLFTGIKMRKSALFIPFFIFTFIEIFAIIYLMISSLIVVIQNDEYSERLKKFINTINIPETAGLGIWIYFYLCISSLYDVIKCEEMERKLLAAKDSITYGSVDNTKGSSSL